MAKYRNISKLKILLHSEGKLISIAPGQEVELPTKPPGFDSFLEEVIVKKDKPKVEPDDFYVLIDDSILEELKEEQNKPTKRKHNRREK